MTLPVEKWAENVRAGDVLAVSRAITAIENHQPEAEALLRLLFPHTGQAYLTGVTGAPGTGKSTLVDRLATYHRKRQEQVGVIAVDPTSPYTGGAILTRPNLRVKSIELRSYLSEAGSDNSLERSYADGKVEIQQTSPTRTRTGTGEHAEYYTAEDKIILRGGAPGLVDSLKGNTHGSELTYFASDDRLIVNGAPEKPAQSRIRRKKQQQ